MQWWSYRVLFIFALTCTACSNQPKQPATQVESKSEPAAVAQVEPTPNPAATEPSPTAQPAALQVTKSESKVRLPELEPLEVEGNFSAVGSSTVFPLSNAIYQHFIKSGYAGTIQFDINSTSAGFKVLCQEGKADIANASRAMKEEEIQACIAAGRRPIEFRIGTDAVVVVVNRQNTFVTNVTKQELAGIFTAEKWSDVNPKWPNEKIIRIVPTPESSRFDLLVNKVFDGDKQQLLKAVNTESSEDNNYLLNGLLANQYGLTLFPYAFYKKNAKDLKSISIEGVQPTAETAENGTYILNRPLFIYSEANTIRKKPQVSAFINFYLTYLNQEIVKVGYFPVSTQELDNSKNKLLEAIGQTELESN